jgi:hypothetical protein
VLDEFMEAYDAVVTGDGSFEFVLRSAIDLLDLVARARERERERDRGRGR